LVSVIIPVYNVEKYLDRCLASVIGQDYSNIEIILVDDGSTDSSAEICTKWVKLYPDKIRAIHQSNMGASIARKTGITEAKGEYLTFVDSDDYVMPQYISELYRAANDNNAKVAVCPFLKVPEGYKSNRQQTSVVLNRLLEKQELFERFFKYEFWGFWGGIYAKSLFDSVIYPTETVNEDYYIKAQIFSKVKNVGYCPTPLYIYETHQGSLSNLKLSIRALGEFDNAYATWRYIRETLPEYSSHALAIASEAACKWLGAINRRGKAASEFGNYKAKISEFIHHNFRAIFSNHALLWKVRIVLGVEYLKSLLV